MLPPKTATRRQSQRSSSFPHLASFNPFRRKPPEPSKPRISSERFEVAPGIFNTDATAQVFGYLDGTDPNKSSRSTINTDPDKPKSQRPEQSKSPIKKLIERYKETHVDDGTDDFSTRTHRRHVEAFDRARQEKRDDAKRQREENEKRGRRGRRMRTVSKDDELLERGANPRTGLVSPFVLSDGSGDSANGGYIVEGHRLAARDRRGGSGKWKQHTEGWSLIESPLLSTIANSVNNQASRAVSVKHLEDKFVVETSRVDNSKPMHMTDDQIRTYHERTGKAPIYCAKDYATVDPNTPTPIMQTSEGPSTSPSELRNIRRKEVGSGRSSRTDARDRVTSSKEVRASSMPTPRKETEQQKVRISTSNNHERQAPSFHGQPQAQGHHQKQQNSSGHFQTPDAFPPRRLPITDHATHRHQCHSIIARPSTSSLSLRPHPETMNQLLPRLHDCHPSHVDNLTKSYERPRKFLPENCRGPQIHMDAPTMTTAITREQKGRNRPGELTTLSSPTATQFDLLVSSTVGLHRALNHGGDVYQGWVTPDMPKPETAYSSDQGTKAIAKQRGLMPTCMCQQCKAIQGGIKADRVRMATGLTSGNLHTMRDPNRQTRNRAGYFRIDGDLDDHKCIENPRQMLQSRAQEKSHGVDNIRRIEVEQRLKEASDVKGRFAYVFGGAEEEKLSKTHVGKPDKVDFGQGYSLAAKIDNTKRYAETIDLRINTAVLMQYIQHQLLDMFRHILSTLNPSSPAIKVLRMSDSTREDFLVAVKDVGLAIIYLLILFSVVGTVGKGLQFVMRILHCIWSPLRTFLGVLKWCVAH